MASYDGFTVHNDTGAVIATVPVTLNGDPTTALHAATKQYVDAFAIPSNAGTPTDAPANAARGIALIYDTTAHKLWAYDTGTSSWKGVALT